MPETITFTIEGDDGSTDQMTVPEPLMRLLRTGEESSAEIIGDLAMLTCAQQVHAFVHHSDGEPGVWAECPGCRDVVDPT